MKAYLIFDFFYDFTSKKVTIGGVQTYLNDLATIFLSLEYNTTILQCGKSEQTTRYNNYEVHQLAASTCEDLVKKAANSIINVKKDIVVYGSDTIISRKSLFQNSIAIQHGIWWDKPSNSTPSKLQRFFPWLPSSIFLKFNIKIQSKNAFEIISRLGCVQKVVCVDYNFVNWYRTLVKRNRTELHVVPNYTKIETVFDKASDTVNIIFARRLFEYRGTRVFVEAVNRILEEYKNVHVTIAGSGPDEEWMRQQLKVYENVVDFVRYKPDESIKIHSDKHIAVVPTIGSEGTSLSLLEAMSAQCAVVCSDVGGMTNIILNGYNGLMVRAGKTDELYYALKRLIDNPQAMRNIAKHGYETVKTSFSYEGWANSWKQVIKEFANEK